MMGKVVQRQSMLFQQLRNVVIIEEKLFQQRGTLFQQRGKLSALPKLLAL
ncbi:unnamed protein product [Meloidogyne enterolobii]|uniref:Uncharacterized protein n=1 Tax=Meloidogyne enterolobii TaxID=390850 RepID=A0ACB0Z1S6_MELEN